MKNLLTCLQQPALKWVGCFLLSSVAVHCANAYERIVSTTGNASEVIAELGLANKLVAVDTTSTKPTEIMKNKAKIGYRRALSSEGILSMTPDLLILAPDAGPPAVVKQIESANLKTITIKDEKSLDGVIADIEMIADTLGVRDKAQAIIDKIRTDEAEIDALITAYPRQPKIVFFMDGGTGRYMGLGAGTAGDGMIAIIGGENSYAHEFNSVKLISLESLATSDMDMIIIASHGGQEETARKLTKALNKYPKLAITKAGKNGCVFTIGLVESLGFGPNLTDSAKEIASAVKPCLQHE